MSSAWIYLALIGFLYLEICSAELKLIQVVHRHGNRAPNDLAEIYPNDPYTNETYYPEGAGGLTNKGKMSVYKLGKFLSERYGSWLGSTYTQDLIRFRADEIERIVMSGQLIAAALFPPNTLQRWNSELKWQPIPIWTIPLMEDYIYNGLFCTNYKKMRTKIENNDEHLVKRREDLKDFFEYLSEHTGAKIGHYESFFLRQYLTAQRDLGLKLPEWTKCIFPNGKLNDVATYDVIIQSYTTDMKKLTGGPWIQQWLQHISDHLNTTSPDKRKAFIYSGHEFNVASILTALNIYDNKVPSYSSAIIFELHKVNDELSVQVIHKDEEKVRTVIIPGCHNIKCPLKIFKEVVAPIIPGDLKKQCGEISFDIF